MDVWLYICVLLLNVAPNTLTLGTLSAARPANNLALSRTSTAALEGLLWVKAGLDAVGIPKNSHPTARPPCPVDSFDITHFAKDHFSLIRARLRNRTKMYPIRPTSRTAIGEMMAVSAALLAETCRGIARLAESMFDRANAHLEKR